MSGVFARPHGVYASRTEEEVRKYAIRKDEYLGVLGKGYKAMEHEKRLKDRPRQVER